MSDIKNLYNTEAIDKLKCLVDDINVCLFCTNLKTDDGAMCRPMEALEVCDQGNIWFFSDINSDKNNEVKQDKKVQLYFSHPGKSSYLIVNGEAEVIVDRKKITELWTPAAQIWFKEGKNDPNISIIKVKPTTAYYWDTDGNKMVNFLKMAASVITGKNMVTGNEGEIKI